MKRLCITGVEPAFYRDIELIAGLFFEEVKAVEPSAGPGDYAVRFFVEESPGEVTVTARLAEGDGEPRWSASHRRNVEEGEVRLRRRRLKQAISHALLQVLQQATGIVQPWGILTGVRPTKLMHKLLLEGRPWPEVRRVLEGDYLLIPEKIDLLEEIVLRQRKVLPDLYELDRSEVSLYIGIPFCPTKCAYCTFPAYAIRGRNGSVEEFLACLHEEIAAVGEWLATAGLRVTTVYFGGGTPTSITAEQLDGLFRRIHGSIPALEGVREWTVEAGRPDTIDEEKLAVLKKWKVDRISINPQSFREETLKAIGRHHTVRETLEKMELARRMGMNNINMDLIIGLPGEGLDIFRRSLEMIGTLRPESLTVHTLSFKRGSVMTRNKDRYQVAERDEVARMVELARTWAKEAGYHPYYLYRQKNILGNQENVGYALPGFESLYNIIIMEELQTIIGLGCGAVSKIIPPGKGKVTRWPNPKEPKMYVDACRRLIPEKLEALSEAYGLKKASGVG
ncbi:oxygen-independent coproporphyrinogen-3 oxidase [Planifilum fulgidum]|uniref:Oxygen-independent coproporphyrinogen-3 oxidase n=1 Tax=Planifilum fulgidum TaxID=201973 RepID=A0A1I2KEB5_9BACL|nr:coproporphyrinogen III oxidase [Planifilum fulgidum]SFF64550.1 oxygen-independent coproporphyrinogen-3 oxidase [Planifilum fulgidum]